ncbi:MAG: acyl-CoA dehydrogenase [Phenylobacterium sp.]|nr:acyl-CoA dehydrogenase [Phenylobacterium sp.]
MLTTLARAEIPAEDEALRGEVREFLAEQMTRFPAARRARTWMGYDAEFSRALGAKGWVGMNLPKAYGGGDRGYFARFVLIEELLAAGAPVAFHWVAERQSGPLILRYGTEEQKRTIVPRICRGEASFCIGMSEPNSGSDLASVRTRADPTDNGWRLNGSKIWTTYGHKSDFMIALVRTSGKPEDRHAGLSQLLIDMKTPGITARPIRDLSGDEHFSEVHFNDVELPPDALLGEEGRGWAQVNAELAFERSGPERALSSVLLADLWLKLVRARNLRTDSERELAGWILTQLAPLRNLSLAVTAMLAGGESPVVEASMIKDLGTGFEQALPALVTDYVASLQPGEIPDDLLAALDYLAGMSPSFSLRGGTREIIRGIIARGLGLR